MMIKLGRTAKRAAAGRTDARLADNASVRDGDTEIKGRDDVVKMLWLMHCLSDCIKTVGPQLLKAVIVLLVCGTIWVTGGTGMEALGWLFRSFKPW
jgi:hypothetical protein